MHWEDITDEAGKAVQQALTGLTGEAATPAGNGQELAERLQDAGFLAEKLKLRERYRASDAFRRMKRRETIRKRMHYLVWPGAAACLAVTCSLWWFLKTEPSLPPVVLTQKTEELRPAEMKAVLVKADGEQIVLGKQDRQLLEKNGVQIAADSAGLTYTRQHPAGVDTLATNTLIVPRGGMYLLTLSDGTQVWLNADSRLEYPLLFSGEKREVKLSGEAYFDVVKNDAAPFVVKTGWGNIKVWGTRFNVKCYPEESTVATTLVSGKVSFSGPSVPDISLEPGQQLCYEKGADRTTLKEVNVLHYVGWKDNLLVFQNETLENIMRVLSRWYDIQVVFGNDSLKQLKFSGNLDKYTGIGTFLRLFEIGSGLRFELEDRVLHIQAKND